MTRTDAAGTGPLAWGVVAGGVFTAVGGGFADAFLVSAASVATFAPLAALAAGLVGGPLWYLLVEVPDTGRWLFLLRAGLVGAMTGLLAHPVLWGLFGLVATGGLTPAVPVHAGVGAVLFGLVSTLLTGWLTVPIGVGVGLALAALRAVVRRVG